jgi:hypothetical protein
MYFQTWKTPDGSWKGQVASETVKGFSREEVIDKLKVLMRQADSVTDDNICDSCDPIKMPLCNKCLGS